MTDGPSHIARAHLKELAQQVIGLAPAEPFGVYLFRAHEPGADLARHVEQSVFLEAFGAHSDHWGHEYGRYEASSLFICVVDHLRWLPVGAMRVVLPSPAGFKSLDDLERFWGERAEVILERTGMTFDLTKTWDVATLAVDPEYRGRATHGLVAMGLYQTLTLAARSSGIDWLVAIFDMPTFRMLRWKMHMVFAGYAGVGPVPYLGSPACIPAWCDLCAAERVLAASDRDLHAILFEGTGLESGLRPADPASFEGLTTRPLKVVGG